jgi:hypothetical protein
LNSDQPPSRVAKINSSDPSLTDVGPANPA